MLRCEGECLKINGGTNREIVLRRDKGVECEVCIDFMRFEHLLEYKYFACVLKESGINEVECSRKVVGGRRAVGAIRSLVNASGLQLECTREHIQLLLVPVLMYGSERML